MGIILFLVLFILANFYIGLKGYYYLVALMPVFNATVYWIIFWLVAFAFILSRVRCKYISSFFRNILNWIGSLWLVFLLYGLMGFLLIDLIKLIIPPSFFSNLINVPVQNLYGGTLLFAVIMGIIIYGTYQARNIKLKTYEIIIPKASPTLGNLNVVFLSDTHLGNMVNNKRLEKIVAMINSLSPDIVLWGGDIIDDSIKPFVKQNMAATLHKIKSTYGVYGVLGNHDGPAARQAEVIANLEAGGIKILVDEYVKINDAFYLVGRNDNQMPRGSNNRKPLDEILSGIDTALPIILMDHNPGKYWEAKQHNIDLQFSGHTHGGQFFPTNLITKRIFATDWGYLQNDNFQLIVSSGAATWGPPLRIGTDSEIVHAHIIFSNPSASCV